MKRSAIISDCGQYRYVLSRDWGPGFRLTFIGLNPSTADAYTDDPTVRRLIGFTNELDCGGFDLLNLFALRTSFPKELARHPHPCGTENDKWLETIDTDVVIACWGRHGTYLGRDRFVADMIRRDLHCFGVNKDATPKHPLYLPKGTGIVKYVV